MSLKITWEEKERYPTFVKGVAAGIVDGRLLVVGGMSYPWREVEYGFWMAVEGMPGPIPSLIIPGENVVSIVDEWRPMPPLPFGPGWTSGAAIHGGLAVVGGRRKVVGNKAIADVFFLNVRAGATIWERLPDRPSPAMIPTTFADEPYLYTAFGTDWQPWEHAIDDTNVYRMNILERKDNMAAGWEIVTRFPSTPRWMSGMAVCNKKLYVIGGRDIPLDGVDDLKLHNPHNAYTEPGPDSLWPRVHYREAWEYDFDTDEWKELPYPPRAFVADAFTVEDRWIVLAGGTSYDKDANGETIKIRRFNPRKDCEFEAHSHEVWAYDTHTGEWLELDPLPYGLCSHRIATWKDRVYTVGNEVFDGKRSNTCGTVFVGHIEVSTGRISYDRRT